MAIQASDVTIDIQYNNDASGEELMTTLAVGGIDACSITHSTTDKFSKRLERVMGVDDARCLVKEFVSKAHAGSPFTAYMVSQDGKDIGFFSFESYPTVSNFGLKIIMKQADLTDDSIPKIGVIFRRLMSSISAFRGNYTPIRNCLVLVSRNADARVFRLVRSMGFERQDPLWSDRAQGLSRFLFIPE
jgi:hypothetical protein